MKNMSSPLSFLQGLATSLSVWEAVYVCAHGVFLFGRQLPSDSAGLAKGISRPPSPPRMGRLSSQKATNQIEFEPMGAVWRCHEFLFADGLDERKTVLSLFHDLKPHHFSDNVRTHQFNVGQPWTLKLKSGLRKLLFWLREPWNESTWKPPNKAESFKEN